MPLPGQSPDTPAVNRPRTRLLRWRSVVKNTLRGFENGNRWANLPGRPQIEDNRVRLDIRNKPLYQPVCEWRDKDLRDRFSAVVVALVLEHNPRAFSEQGGRAP